MGLILCSKHGESGFTSRISKKVCDNITAETLRTDEEVRIFTINVLVDPETSMEEKYLLYADEAEILNLPRSVTVTTEEEYDIYHKLLPKMGGMCAKCLREYKERYGLSLMDFN